MVTIQRITKLFNQFNGNIFAGKLIRPQFEVDKMDTEVGYCIDDDDHIVIGIADDLNDMLLKCTLIHEMVHLWQIQNKKKVDHSLEFQKWKKEIKYYGFNI